MHFSHILSSLLALGPVVQAFPAATEHTSRASDDQRESFLCQGQRVWKYEQVGSGGYGDVYRGVLQRRGKPNQPVAIKVFHGQDNEEPLKGYELGKRLDHRNLMKVYEKCRHGGRDYVLTEWLEGSDGFDILRDGDFADDTSMSRIINGLLEGLRSMHKHRIAHRDIKPENFMVQRDLHWVKTVDYDMLSTKSRASEHCGTPLYMSPELARPSKFSRTSTEKDDVWAIAMTILQLVARRVPWDGGSSSTALLLWDEKTNKSRSERLQHKYRITADLADALSGAFAPEKSRVSMATLADNVSKVENFRDGSYPERKRVTRDASVVNPAYGQGFVCLRDHGSTMSW